MKHTENHAILNRLKDLITEKHIDPAEKIILTELVDHYFVAICREELAGQSVETLYAKFYSHFQFMNSRQPHQIKLRVFNPQEHLEGYTSPHTVIQLTQDDMPFVIDSILMELNRQNIKVHFIIHNGAIPIVRDTAGKIIEILDRPDIVGQMEANAYIEIEPQGAPEVLQKLEEKLYVILADVMLAVEGFKAMHAKMQSIASTLDEEEKAFLHWLCDNHFTFLGYGLFENQDGLGVRAQNNSLGIMDEASSYDIKTFNEDFPPFSQTFSKESLLICKSGYASTVHRAGYMDAILIREFNSLSEIVREHRFLGLFTSRVYHLPSSEIPLLRKKVKTVYTRAHFAPMSHDIKALEDIIESFAKDEMFQMTTEQFYKTAMGILYMQERQQIKLFIRKDIVGRFYNVMVYLPRDLFNTKLRLKFQNLLLHELDGTIASFAPHFLGSVMCRLDFFIRVDETTAKEINVLSLEQKLKRQARNWQDDLYELIVQTENESRAAYLCNKYAQAFHSNYQEDFKVKEALKDISNIETLLSSGQELTIEFEQDDKQQDRFHLKMMQCHKGLWLTHVLPILDNFGLKVIEERPYELKLPDDLQVWISDFLIEGADFADRFDAIKEHFKQALTEVWNKQAENDGFNRLVLLLGLSVREVVLLRAIGKYLIQINFVYSQGYFEDTLVGYPQLTRALVKLFFLRFNPELSETDRQSVSLVATEIEAGLKKVKSLDHDRILRKYRDVLKAMVRTNYFQKTPEGKFKSCVSFKLAPEKIPDLPQPVPFAEIFVYAPEVEGVHLRAAKVARGGIRWSDRREDFRTEVLGLMKAQQVKNAVIVPLGAKGGFYPKNIGTCNGREAIQAEAIRCYKVYISAMLDLTDNILNGKIIPPIDVIRYDEDDPYFVVAADKGTATFSDIANGISCDYQFWLGDAFASGGSNGYDHKKMGITAKGAWESVKRHFLFFNKDIQNQDFTVIGIGDMSGDVFGNGMLLSQHIRLVAAFNHMHIFLDPDPDAALSFAERIRLFNLPRSGWQDYNPALISSGGGIYERSLKTISISPEVKLALNITADELEPSQLIQAILKSPVELLWNGGIGTYVKASTQTSLDVGDRANDPLRIDANQLRCQVVGEGGNLGFTQLARVEYALLGGQICTDAIDNSAGVDCSDHEVNIKILLNTVMQKGNINLESRNHLLTEMETEVAALVLADNYEQTQAISNGVHQVAATTTYIRLLRELEREGFINRQLEALPTDKVLKARIGDGYGFTKPEFSVLMAYAKTTIKKFLLETDLPEEPYCARYLYAEFPKILTERFSEEMTHHHLKREIIVTQLTNSIVRFLGIAYVHRMYDEVGAPPAMSIRAAAAAIELYQIEEIWQDIEKLDGKVPAEAQIGLMNEITYFLQHQCRWLLRQYRTHLNIESVTQTLQKSCQEVLHLTRKLINSDQHAVRKVFIEKYNAMGVPKNILERVADVYFVYSALDMINAAHTHHLEIADVMKMYYTLSQAFGLSWLRQKLNEELEAGYWEMLTASSLKDDLNSYQARLVISILKKTEPHHPATHRIEEWSKNYSYYVRRWHILFEDFKISQQEFVRMASLINGLKDLVELSER